MHSSTRTRHLLSVATLLLVPACTDTEQGAGGSGSGTGNGPTAGNGVTGSQTSAQAATGAQTSAKAGATGSTAGQGGGEPTCSDLGPDPICEAANGNCYYVSNKAGSGAGTFDDPFGMADLPRSDLPGCGYESKALGGLQPGDIIYFRGGDYKLMTCEGENYYAGGYLIPDRSGEPDKPITFKAYPRERVALKVEGGQAAFGTYHFGKEALDYIHFSGFVVNQTYVRIYGKGNAVSYCEFIGKYVETTTNNDSLRIEFASEFHVHHNVLHGRRGPNDWVNSAAIKLYDTNDGLIEDNYVYDNSQGIFDKDSGINNTYRRNLFRDNVGAFMGNNQDKYGTYFIYDNVLFGDFNLHFHQRDTEIHDNLVIAGSLAGAWAGDVWTTSLWNNIVVTDQSSITAFYDSQVPLSKTLPDAHLTYFNYNVYSAPPTYLFGKYSPTPQTFSLDQIRGEGFEQDSRVLESSKIFSDPATYILDPSLATAGRDGSAPGPEDAAKVLDTSRYGPDARCK